MAVVNMLGAVRSLLADDPDVAAWTEGRVYSGEFPDRVMEKGEVVPYPNLMPRRSVLIQQPPAPHNQGYVRVQQPGITTRCYAETPEDAYELDLVVYERLHYMNREIHRHALIYFVQATSTGTQLRDAEGRWPCLFRTYTAMIGEAVYA